MNDESETPEKAEGATELAKPGMPGMMSCAEMWARERLLREFGDDVTRSGNRDLGEATARVGEQWAMVRALAERLDVLVDIAASPDAIRRRGRR